jgi:small GTP-binding protein
MKKRCQSIQSLLTHIIIFERIEEYHSIVKDCDPTIPIVLIGSMCDLIEKCQISDEEIKQVSKRIGAYTFIKCSGKININVDEIFQTAVTIKRKRLDIKKALMKMIPQSLEETKLEGIDSIESVYSPINKVKNAILEGDADLLKLLAQLEVSQLKEEIINQLDFGVNKIKPSLLFEVMEKIDFQSLQIINCSALTDKQLIIFLRNSRELQKLSICNVSINSNELVEQLNQYCPHIRILHIENLPNLTWSNRKETLIFQSLHELKIINCQSLVHLEIYVPNLVSLHIENCKNLERITLKSAVIPKSVTIKNCKLVESDLSKSSIREDFMQLIMNEEWPVSICALNDEKNEKLNALGYKYIDLPTYLTYSTDKKKLPTQMKCVAVGDYERTGKTNMKTALLCTLTKGFYPEYVSYDNIFIIQGKSVSLTLWDTAGNEEYDRTRHLCYPGTDIFWLCFSVLSPQSFNHVKSTWWCEVSHHCPNALILLIGLNIELRDDKDVLNKLGEKKLAPITYQQGKNLSKEIEAIGYDCATSI